MLLLGGHKRIWTASSHIALWKLRLAVHTLVFGHFWIWDSIIFVILEDQFWGVWLQEAERSDLGLLRLLILWRVLNNVCLSEQQAFAAFAIVPRLPLLSNSATRLFIFDDCFRKTRTEQLMLFHLLLRQVELLLVKGRDDVGTARWNILWIIADIWVKRVWRGWSLSQRKSGLLTLNLLICNLHLLLWR